MLFWSVREKNEASSIWGLLQQYLPQADTQARIGR
jgi:hypothetical protein